VEKEKIPYRENMEKIWKILSSFDNWALLWPLPICSCCTSIWSKVWS